MSEITVREACILRDRIWKDSLECRRRYRLLCWLDAFILKRVVGT